MRSPRLLLWLLGGLYALVLVRTAWLCDDAYITLRTVDNVVRGLGPTWNPAERVQAYTHPLWMFLLAGGHAVTGETYFTTLALSMAASLAAVAWYAWRVAWSGAGAALGLLVLLLSRAFVDYSTSGLENPLSHLLLVLFLGLFLADETPRRFPRLAILAGLCALNRLDLLLLVGPALLVAARGRPLRRVAADLLLGFAPFLVWECFSVVYYGFPFPNTAYAKLSTGLPASALAAQGLHYLENSLRVDPLTPAAIVAGTGLALRRRAAAAAVAVGIVLHLAYVVRVGGDFMSGRFLAAPLLCAVAVLGRLPPALLPRRVTAVAVGLAVLLGAAASPPTLATGAGFDTRGQPFDHGIADERGEYFQATGLLNCWRHGRPRHPWVDEGRRLRAAGGGPVVVDGVGLQGAYAGPWVHIVDGMALADPLLAHLPIRADLPWRIGHFRRKVPRGYRESVAAGTNRIVDPNHAAYYEKLRLVTRDELFAPGRFGEIWRLNAGRDDDLLRPATRPRVVPLHVLASAVPEGAPWDHPDTLELGRAGIELDLGGTSHAPRLEMGLDRNDDYQVTWLRRGTPAARLGVPATDRKGGIRWLVVEVPEAARRGGYDRVRVAPLAEDGGSALGHLRLVDDDP